MTTPEPTNHTENRLRRALSMQAEKVEPDMNALDEIGSKIDSAGGSTTRARAVLALAAVSVVILGIAAFVSLSDGGDDPLVVAGTGTGTTSTSTSTGATQPDAPAVDPADYGIFVMAETFEDPVEAVQHFVMEWLGSADRDGIANATFSEFMQGDSNSGEVQVRRGESGPLTTVLVRKAPDENWAVTGAVSDSISIETPEVLTTVESPFEVSGVSTAFEATVNIELRADGTSELLFEGFTNGGANGEFAPYSTLVEFAQGGHVAATLLVVESDASGDGTYSSVSAFRVRLSQE